MQFFKTLQILLQSSDVALKAELLEALYQNFILNRLEWDEKCEIVSFKEPSYAALCDIIDPKAVPKRNRLSTLEGRRIFLHAIVHIEYSAIDLALDACYRFRGLPRSFYHDWLEVARDEMRHFKMLEALLHKHQSFYGAYSVHDALFEAGLKTPNLLERMAVVPRFMEANGLDANPKLIKKLLPFKQEAHVEEMIKALELILKEEIEHVKKGNRWFEYACKEKGVDKSIYFEIIKRFYPRTFPRMHAVNVQARQEAGFSCSELKEIAQVEC